MKKIIIIVLSLLIPTNFSAMPIKARSATATLSGAVVAGVSVTLTDNVKAFERKATTSGDGNFIFTQLPPSRYTVKVAQNGFADNRGSATQKMTTDKDGKITIKFDKSGLWLVRLVNMRRCAADCNEADWESFWGALSFGVENKYEI